MILKAVFVKRLLHCGLCSQDHAPYIRGCDCKLSQFVAHGERGPRLCWGNSRAVVASVGYFSPLVGTRLWITAPCPKDGASVLTSVLWPTYRDKATYVRDNSRSLVDTEKGGVSSDEWEPKNGKVNPLWRPGGGWKPGTFLDPQGPKVG
jgi:hypothetical protein